jgi:hypothetical protein
MNKGGKCKEAGCPCELFCTNLRDSHDLNCSFCHHHRCVHITMSQSQSQLGSHRGSQSGSQSQPPHASALGIQGAQGGHVSLNSDSRPQSQPRHASVLGIQGAQGGPASLNSDSRAQREIQLRVAALFNCSRLLSMCAIVSACTGAH